MIFVEFGFIFGIIKISKISLVRTSIYCVFDDGRTFIGKCEYFVLFFSVSLSPCVCGVVERTSNFSPSLYVWSYFM